MRRRLRGNENPQPDCGLEAGTWNKNLHRVREKGLPLTASPGKGLVRGRKEASPGCVLKRNLVKELGNRRFQNETQLPRASFCY